jgi:hypothetical protein
LSVFGQSPDSGIEFDRWTPGPGEWELSQGNDVDQAPASRSHFPSFNWWRAVPHFDRFHSYILLLCSGRLWRRDTGFNKIIYVRIFLLTFFVLLKRDIFLIERSRKWENSSIL